MEQEEPNNKALAFCMAVYGFFCEHWVWKTIIGFFPGVWVPVIVNKAGVIFNLVDDAGRFHWWTWCITAVVYGASFLMQIATNRAAKQVETLNSNMLQACTAKIENDGRLLQSMREICNQKYTAIVDRNYYRTKSMIQVQIQNILKELQSCLCESLNKSGKDIVISLAYNYYDADGKLSDDGWEGIGISGNASNATVRRIAAQEKSTFHCLVYDDDPFILYNEKEQANKDEKYIYNGRDKHIESNGKKRKKSPVMGSIAGFRVKADSSIGPEMVAALCISTFGFRFVDDKNDVESFSILEKNLITDFFPEFEVRLKIELANMALCEHKLHNKSTRLRLKKKASGEEVDNTKKGAVIS